MVCHAGYVNSAFPGSCVPARRSVRASIALRADVLYAVKESLATCYGPCVGRVLVYLYMEEGFLLAQLLLEEFQYERLLNGEFLRNKELDFSRKRRLREYLKENLGILIHKLENDGIERSMINNILLKCFFSKCFIDRYDYFTKKIKRDYKVNSFEELILNLDQLYQFFNEISQVYEYTLLFNLN